MNLADLPTANWQARLELDFAQRDTATILSRREHFGPLRVQKALYPEGDAVCHAIILHPPSGIAGGDQLDIIVRVGQGAHALLTTPGAGKWYRSAGASARQGLTFKVAGILEWLPQENIVFDGVRAEMQTHVDLTSEACFIGMETLCLGRRAAGETFVNGVLRMENRVLRNGQPIWLERGRIDGGADLLHSPAGLAGFSVCATLLAAAPGLVPSLTALCREITVAEPGARHAVTLLPDRLLARYLGHSSEAARDWMASVWRVLRPALIGREAQLPRIWKT